LILILEHENINDKADVMTRMHAVLDNLESLIKENNTNIDADKVFVLIERISSKRPEGSVINLVIHKASKLNAMMIGWIKNLTNFMEKFYRNESNQAVRIVALEYFKEIINRNRVCYEEEILEDVVIVIFSDIAQEHDIKIRVAVCKLLLEICSHCETKRCLELLDILEKVMNHPFDLFSLNNTILKNEYEFEDSLTVVNGMIDLFLEKLHQLPINHAIKIYHILIGHLETHYQQPKVFEHATKIRYRIINWMLRVRANSAFQIGYPSPQLISENIKYSHYLALEGEYQLPPQTPSNLMEIQCGTEEKPESVFNFHTLTTLSIKRGCKIIVKCLDLEKDWYTVQLVLRELPKIMQNKTLIQGNDVDLLARSLSELFRISYDKEQLIDRFTTFNEQKDFRALVIPAIASLITYNIFLSIMTKKKIVEILKSEVRFDGSLSVCVQAFTILLMERCDIFERQLADIVLAISKVSDTVLVALPILEFMSTITHLPYSFTNLNQKQFSYVFATCLPYTSPARYDHYIVSLAHHIIASWFLKSRLQWRKGYADYIIEGIAKNIDKSMQDAKQLQRQIEDGKNFSLLNEDSSLRKRSSSLTEQSSRKKEINNPQMLKLKAQRAALQKKTESFDMHSFHIELIETCIDFMARHTYSLSLALPRRLPTADYLLRGGGQSKSWICGHVIVTITTNACMDIHDWNSCSCYCSDWVEIIIRRPTGMLSWLMKFQNQVGTFANEFSFHDLKGLFSEYELDPENPNGILCKKKKEDEKFDSSNEVSLSERLSSTNEVIKIPLQSTASDSAVFNSTTQPINIPATLPKSNADKELIEDEDASYEDDSDDMKRNPVRRVNSSPEMRSNWKVNMSNRGNNSKDSKSGSSSTVTDEQEDLGKNCENEAVQQKKKTSYSKETKVSCEAIPEEINTSFGQKEENSVEKVHRSVQLLSSVSAQETANVTSIPKKQHSADDTIQLRRSDGIVPTPILTYNKTQDWSSHSTSSNLPLSPRYQKVPPVGRQISHHVPLESDVGYRARSKTISVIGRNKETFENQSKASDFSVSTSSIEQSQHQVATSGISPSFVFVQLFNTGKMDVADKPLQVTDKHKGTLNLLDLIPPYEIHKIGVVYVKPGQANNEIEILRNVNGSLRYIQFLHNLGSLIAIKDAKEKKLFVNMEPKREGNFTYVWYDDIIQMTFHVATLM
jgi:Tuberin/Rap/ran-GAP